LHSAELTIKSDRLFDALRQLRAADQGLRDQRISSGEFHRLADEVEVLRDELSALVRDERVTGNRTTRTVDGRIRSGREVSERARWVPTGASSSELG
jgi:hypothetical protein